MFTIISKNYSNITLTIIVILVCVSIVIFNHNRLLNHYIKKQINDAGIEGMTIPSLDFSPDTSFCNKYQSYFLFFLLELGLNIFQSLFRRSFLFQYQLTY